MIFKCIPAEVNDYLKFDIAYFKLKSPLDCLFQLSWGKHFQGFSFSTNSLWEAISVFLKAKAVSR